MDNSWRNVFAGRVQEHQFLLNALAVAKTGHPQVVTLVAETGWGKTRIVQHLYETLALGQPEDHTYWPRQLVDQTDYERARRRVINPSAKSLGQGKETPTFLWVGLQGDEQTEVNETGAFLRVLQPHFRPLLCARLSTLTEAERKEAMKELGINAGFEAGDAASAIAETLLGEIPIVKQILAGGKIINILRQLAASKRAIREGATALNQQCAFAPAAEALRGQGEAEGECLEFFRHYFELKIPTIIVADDAHWLNPEPVNVLRRVFDLAQRMEAPLVIVGTHWRSEWHNSPSNYAEWAQALHAHRACQVSSEPDLILVVQTALPNLQRADAQRIVDQGDGQPLFVLQILQEALEHRDWFEDGGIRLSALGASQISQVGTFGEFCQRRFSRLATDTKRLLGWGSVQGSTFLHRLTRAVGDALQDLPDHDALLRDAHQKGIAVPRQSTDGSRFDQYDFRRLAERFLEADGNREMVIRAINAALVQEINGGILESLPREERMDLARIAIRQLGPDSDATGDYAWARAVLDLGLQEAEDRNWSTAVGLLLELATKMKADWATSCLRFWLQIEACRMLLAHGKSESAQKWVDMIESGVHRERSIILGMRGMVRQARGDLNGALQNFEQSLSIARELALELRTPKSRRDFSLTLTFVALAREAQGLLRGALEAHKESLKIRYELAQELGTPESIKDAYISLSYVAAIREAWGDFRGALKNYEECVPVFRNLAQFWDTPESRRDVSIALANVARIREAYGDVSGALPNYQESLAIRRGLAQELGTPESRSDVAISLDHMGGILQKSGELSEALQNYEESLAIRRELAKELGTPKSRRDVSVSLDGVAGILQRKGELIGALQNYEESLSIRQALDGELGTPESRRDVSVSLNYVARILEAQGDLNGASQNYEECVKAFRVLAKELGTTRAWRDLVLSLAFLANLQGQLNTQAACAHLREAFGINERLMAESPDIVQFIEDRESLTLIWSKFGCVDD